MSGILLKKLEALDPYLREVMIMMMDEIESKISIRDEIDELKSIVKEMVQSHKEMRNELTELAQAQKNTEAALKEVVQTQKEMRNELTELAQAQKKTEAALKEVVQTQKEMRNELTELAQAQKNTEIQMFRNLFSKKSPI